LSPARRRIADIANAHIEILNPLLLHCVVLYQVTFNYMLRLFDSSKPDLWREVYLAMPNNAGTRRPQAFIVFLCRIHNIAGGNSMLMVLLEVLSEPGKLWKGENAMTDRLDSGYPAF
jgi:hypothetical protein